MSTHKTTETACGKFILVGEHAAVYGTTSVAIPLKQRVIKASTTLTDSSKKIYSSSPSTKIIVSNNLMPDSINSIILEAFELLNIQPFDLTIDIESELPTGAGLGASAALCVVILRLISKLEQKELSPKQLTAYANVLEKRFHGNPSGLDVSVIAFNQIISFSRSRGATPIKTKEFHFALIDSKMRSSTLEMIERAKPFFTDQTKEQKLQKFERISKQSIECLEKGDSAVLASLMSESKNLLDQAGLIDDNLHQKINLCINEIKVLSAKPTGACGGGFIVALLDTTRHLQQLSQIQKTFGEAYVIPVSI